MASMQKKSLIATVTIFCCRFTGLLREIVFTSLFGATGALDAFLTAFRVPNMLRDMFAEGAMSQSFTSVMSKVEKQQGPAAAWSLAHRVSSQLISLMVCIVALGILLAGTFMQQLYPERARVVLQTPWGAPVMQCTDAAFRGFRTTFDGTKEAIFTSNERLAGLTETSCIRVSSVAKLHHGQTLTLTAATEGVPAGATRVEAQSFMGLATNLCRIMWPFILLASVSALCMGALNVFGVFGLPNLASAAFNLTTVGVGAAVGWLIDPDFGPQALYGFAIAVVCGGAAQVLFQLPKMRSKGYRLHWDIGLKWDGRWFRFTDEAARRVWLLMLPGVIAAGITQTNIFINTAFALYLQPGSVTALSSAFHLWQLPVALFGVAVGMVVLPSVSRMALTAGGEAGKEISMHLAKALRFVALFAVPSAIFLCIWGEQIVSVFYQRGRFDAAAAAFTGDVLAAYSLGLLAYAGMKVLQPVFLALEKPWAPAGLALVAFCISVGCNYTFVHVFNMPATYLALTTSIVTTLNFCFYFLYIRHLLGSMSCDVLLPGLLRILGAGTVLAIACWCACEFCFSSFTSWGFLSRFGTLALAGSLAGGIYMVACMLFRVPELQMLTSRLLRRK
ncbi:MAG: murein biosynthesis integral membrane protein MurJ [Akkermansiaceae bacterium]|nr:murein biosynthesis integral membrane protein MurJ [Akkermansiaceae bacterium]